MAGPVRIAILANGSQARRELDAVSTKANGLGSKLKSAAKVAALGAAVAGAAAVKFGAASVKSASDAQQSLGATQTVFGKYADDVIRRSGQAATAIGLSANEYRELSNVVGASLAGAGVPLKETASLTDKLNKRAADMAATFGGTTREAVESVSSLLRGEADPIERYGVSIKQSDVNARLAAKGLDTLTGSALKQAEIQARLDLLFEKTAKTQGSFRREGDTLAHQQQVLAAQFENVKAKVGAALLPVLTTLLTFINANLIPGATALGNYLSTNLGPVVDRIRDGFSALQEKLTPVGQWLRANPELIKGAGIALGVAAVAAGALALAMGAVAVATSPITLAVLAIVGIGAGFAYAYKHSETFRNAVQGIGKAFSNLVSTVLPIARQIAAVVVAKFREMQPQIKSVWASIKSIVSSALSIIRSVIKGATKVITTIWRVFGNDIKTYLGSTLKNVISIVSGAFKVIRGIFKVVSSVLRGDWKGAWSGIKDIVSGALQVIRGLIGQVMATIKAVIGGALSAVKALFSGAWSAIRGSTSTGASAVLSIVRGIPGAILGALSGLGSLLYGAGQSIISGLINGIDSMIGAVKSKLSALTNLIPKVKGPPAKDRRLLRPVGKMIIRGLIKGFDDGRSGVKKSLGSITDLIRDHFDKNRKRARRAIRSLSDETRALINNAKRRERVYKSLAAAQKRLADARKKYADYAVNVRSGVAGYTSITGLNAAFNSDSLIEQMRARLAKVQQFQALISDLVAKGLNKTAIDQLAQAGVEGGLATAQAIADGGRDAVAQFNDLQADINKASGGLGKTTADSMYGAGVKAARNLVKGLRSKRKELLKFARDLAAKMAIAVQKAIGVTPRRAGRASAGRRSDLRETMSRAPRQSGSKTFNVNVNVPPGADKRAVAREIRKMLRDLERTENGRAARAS